MRTLAGLATLLLTTVITGCTTPDPPARLAYCTQLYNLWYRYRSPIAHAHTAQQAPADYALYACQLGRYDEGIAILTDLLQRHKVAVPPPPT